MTRRWLYGIALLTVLGGLLAPSLSAEQNWTSPEEFRTEYLTFIDTLSARIPASDHSTWAVGLRQKISAIRQQVNGLSDSAMDQFSRMTDRQEFTKMVDGLAAGTKPIEIMGRHSAGAVLRTQGAILPPDFASAVAGTTCSTTPTAASTIDGEKIGLYVDRGLSLVAEVACETLVVIIGEGTNLPLCIIWGVTKGIEVVLDSLIDHQEFCNGLLDGAVAEATFNDVVEIHADVEALDTHLTNVDNHIAAEFTALDTHMVALFATLGTQLTNSTNLLSADLKQVMKLELTPEGLRQIVPEILTCTVAANNCPNVLTLCNGKGGVCSWNNVGPLP